MMPYTAKLGVSVSRASSGSGSSSGTSLGHREGSRARWVELAVCDGYTPGEIGRELHEGRGGVQFVE